jgi:hypothetical protein
MLSANNSSLATVTERQEARFYLKFGLDLIIPQLSIKESQEKGFHSCAQEVSGTGCHEMVQRRHLGSKVFSVEPYCEAQVGINMEKGVAKRAR